MTMFAHVERAMTRLATGLALIGGTGLLFATIITCVSIILKLARRVLDALFGSSYVGDTIPWLHAILGEEELVTYGVGFALFAALPWAMIRKGHIRVDLFEPLFGSRFNKILDLLGDLTLAVLAYLIMTRQWFLIVKKSRGPKEGFGELLLQGDFGEAMGRISMNQESQILGMPLWPTYIVAEICVAAFFVTACFCVWRSTRVLFEISKSGV
ncbi:TRAP transporter small permease subunit [Ruegeria pomeroyi]|nr:TRAP transporter small permease subunit [Ruegeria pomeroyi]